MKRFELINETSRTSDLAVLLYFEKSDTYIIEINHEADEDQLPLILSSFYRKQMFTVDPSWSKRFVESRIIPHDRQNLSSILNRYHLKEYDTCRLLELSKGRCAQDDCALLPERQSKPWLLERQNTNLNEAVLLRNGVLMIECANAQLRYISLDQLAHSTPHLQSLIQSGSLQQVDVLPGGYGISFNETHHIMKDELFRNTIDYQPDAQDLKQYYEQSVLTTHDVCTILQCSRQYVNTLVKTNRLPVLKKQDNIQLFLHSDVRRLLW
ncbi:MAG: helix-turn-helix domain-containing protein [Solobacterium sp.]|nr:helix-turn-helix domain-containing protein [Solobacterium sp.]